MLKALLPLIFGAVMAPAFAEVPTKAPAKLVTISHLDTAKYSPLDTNSPQAKCKGEPLTTYRYKPHGHVEVTVQCELDDSANPEAAK